MRYLLHHLLEETATVSPESVAVVDGDRSFSYGELEARSNQVARLVSDLGVERGDRVGLYLDKSLESVAGAYGIMKAGAAYVPLDRDAPPSRLNFIARNCGLRVLLTSEKMRATWPALMEGSALRQLVVVDGENDDWPAGATVVGEATLSAQARDRIDCRCIDQDLAYILYTSGSTGDPKGVMISHRAAMAFVGWAAEEFAVGPNDRLSSHAPLHFDLSVFDLYAAAFGGAAVVLVPPKTSMFPPKLVGFIREKGITVWYSVPSILSMITLRGGLQKDGLPALRTILFAGEVFPTKYLSQLIRLLPDARFANLYGPTETNVCTWHEVGKAELTEPPPIGRAIPNDHVFAITESGSLAGAGEQGELYVRGATVMSGYWGDPELTETALVGDPSKLHPTDRVYRTGDLVEVLESGAFSYLGRRDLQVKTRGYRVELGEVESVLYSHEGVVECAVVAVPDELVTNRLVAFVTLRDGSSVDELMAFCRDRLSKYMVPDAIKVRSELPRTSTGKIDRRSIFQVASSD